MTKPITREHGSITCSEQRNHSRVQLARVSARYAVGPEESVVGDALDISVGGMFLQATRPLPPGTVFELELRVVGEMGPMGAVGRVMWTRERAGAAGEPSGMGVSFDQLDTAACDVIARLVVIRQQTMHGLGPEGPLASPTRAREESSPLHLVRQKEAPLPLVRRKERAQVRAAEVDAGEPTSLPGIALDQEPEAEEALGPPGDSTLAARPPSLLARPRALLAPFAATAAWVLVAFVPGDVSSSSARVVASASWGEAMPASLAPPLARAPSFTPAHAPEPEPVPSIHAVALGPVTLAALATDDATLEDGRPHVLPCYPHGSLASTFVSPELPAPALGARRALPARPHAQAAPRSRAPTKPK